MRPDDHRALRESLGAFALDQLTPAERTAVQAHLDGCPTCRAELTELAELAEPLRRVDPDRLLPTPALPPDLWDGITARIRAERRRPRPPHLRRALAATAAAAAVVIALAVGYQLGQPPDLPLEHVAVSTTTPDLQVSADLVPHTWGTEIKLTGSGFTPGTRYRVLIRGTTEGERVAGEFIGTGSAPMVCNLNSSLPRTSATGFVVLDGQGSVVLSSTF
ncbi:anti-sigma factor family protein [Actinokineospora bangkokensis]|uniref:Putative zinc-finger domain-containing protein n=1 Tax=Actinokineospora bangkokensis TaxID=1193682 RepID=A0A1Q9LQY5_9PSEU|nr:zf-HC2 domain-containing protein [Actinokineospora bangkokensis]OLR94413.1 hypothetical protein BJP25_11675 [Actinokineospora bangkokensis]